jgi:hypothetical protein
MSVPPRRCSQCGELKPDQEFAGRGSPAGKRDTYCRPCRSAYGKKHYAANRTRYIELEAKRKRARAEKRMAYLLDYFKTHPCVDCGEADPLVLEFDHIRDKSFDIAAALPDRNWESILKEIEKCDVVCANCHRRRTARRAGYLRATLVALLHNEEGSMVFGSIVASLRGRSVTGCTGAFQAPRTGSRPVARLA